MHTLRASHSGTCLSPNSARTGYATEAKGGGGGGGAVGGMGGTLYLLAAVHRRRQRLPKNVRINKTVEAT